MSLRYKVDLHTHSRASPDGSLTAIQYRRMLESGGLDYIAITDHDTIEFAQKLKAELGGRIIVGEEITASEGEIIGLYLTRRIPAGLSAAETVERICGQGGLVYVPHPFETVRKGLSAAVLHGLAAQVSIVETRNGRSLQNRGQQATAWAAAHSLPGAASSDAHGWHGWGKTYSLLSAPPTVDSLAILLGSADYHVGSPGILGRLYPKFNRLRKKFSGV